MLSFTFEYSSFWRRVLALVIDIIIIFAVSVVIFDPILTVLGIRAGSEIIHRVPFSIDIVRAYGVWFMMMLVVAWLYCSLMESSRMQATLGKKIMGLLVFTSNEGRLNFRQASLRFCLKIISTMPVFLGFFLALFDPKHRALHDRISGSIVLQPSSSAFVPVREPMN